MHLCSRECNHLAICYLLSARPQSNLVVVRHARPDACVDRNRGELKKSRTEDVGTH